MCNTYMQVFLETIRELDPLEPGVVSCLMWVPETKPASPGRADRFLHLIYLGCFFLHKMKYKLIIIFSIEVAECFHSLLFFTALQHHLCVFLSHLLVL